MLKIIGRTWSPTPLSVPHYKQSVTLKLNSEAVVCRRTIPTERPTLVGEVSANLCG
jgi:hypothetical protein